MMSLLILEAEHMVGMPSVQTCAIAFGKEYEQVAEAVVKFRKTNKKCCEGVAFHTSNCEAAR